MEGGSLHSLAALMFYFSISPSTSLKVAHLHTLDNGYFCITAAQYSLMELNMASLS